MFTSCGIYAPAISCKHFVTSLGGYLMGGRSLIVFSDAAAIHRRQSLGDKFQELLARSPKDAQALERLIDWKLWELDHPTDVKRH